MRSLASWCVRHRRITVLGWLAVLIGCVFAAGTAGTSFKSNFTLPKSDSQRAVSLLKQRFPARSGDSAQVVFHTTQGTVITGDIPRRMNAAFVEIRRLPHVTGVGSPYTSGAEGGGAISPDKATAFATVQFDEPAFQLSKSTITNVIDTAQAAARPGLEVELGGQPIEAAQRVSQNASEAIGVMAAIVVLLITFGSVVAMGLPIITALVALGTGLSLVTLATHVFDVSDFTPALAAMIGLGVGIDYALFIVTRFRSGLREGLDVRDAVITTMDTSGRAVLFAGTTVVISLLGMFALGVDFLHGPAVASSLAVLLTMIAALTLLPALLSKIGTRIDSLLLPGRRRAGAPDDGGFWARWSRFIQRRPWQATIASAAVLVALAIPALSMQLGSADAGTDPSSSTTRKAYDLLAEGFGAGFNGPLLVVADLPRPNDARGLERLSAALRAQPGVLAVAPPRLNPQGNTAILNVFPKTSPQSVKTKDLVLRLRDDVAPVIARTTGIQAHVGGTTAIFEDFASLLSSKLPLFIGIVVALSALLLMAAFRSVLVPLKAVVMNLLSIGAALGVVVAIFQWGWLAGLFGVDATAPIAAFLPVMVFAIVFGLSMDYEVFLMSRVHEEWERRDDPSQAVTAGLAATGRVITAAATIMVCIFASFAFGDILTIKLFGIALASAVFLDAFVIRSVLVPAIMQLLGRSAWWLPGWLDKLLPRLEVEKHAETATASGTPAHGVSQP